MLVFVGMAAYEADPSGIFSRNALRQELRNGTDAERANAALELVASGEKNLAGVKLTWADLSDQDLSGADLSNADMMNAVLAHANLTNANVEGLNLKGALLHGANLSMVALDRATGVTDAFCDGETLMPTGWSCKAGMFAGTAGKH